jgi:hypothetical protein
VRACKLTKMGRRARSSFAATENLITEADNALEPPGAQHGVCPFLREFCSVKSHEIVIVRIER